MDDRVRADEDVLALPEVRQVGDDGQPVLRSVVDQVRVQDVMAVGPEILDDPSAALAAAARDDDPHRWEPRQPFDEPSVSPLMNCRCRTR